MTSTGIPESSISFRVAVGLGQSLEAESLSFGLVWQHLQMAVVALQPQETQAGRAHDLPGQLKPRFTWIDAATSHADIHLNQDPERSPGSLHGCSRSAPLPASSTQTRRVAMPASRASRATFIGPTI